LIFFLPPPGVLPLFDFAAAADIVGFLELTVVVVFAPSIFGNKRSLSIAAVAGVQVDVELTAARIEAAVACRESMMIQDTENLLSVLLKFRHYTKLSLGRNGSNVLREQKYRDGVQMQMWLTEQPRRPKEDPLRVREAVMKKSSANYQVTLTFATPP
jgi:hypothetical protein